MATAVAAPKYTRKSATSTAAEKKFANTIERISRRVLTKLPPSEREERLRKLSVYLDSLERNVAKRA